MGTSTTGIHKLVAGLYWGLDWPKLAQSHMARSDQGHIFLAWAWYRLCIWLCGLYLDWPRPNWHGFVRVKWHGLAKFTWPGLTKTTLIKGSGMVQGMYFDILAWKMLSHMIWSDNLSFTKKVDYSNLDKLFKVRKKYFSQNYLPIPGPVIGTGMYWWLACTGDWTELDHVVWFYKMP